MDIVIECDGEASLFTDMKRGHEMRSKLSDIGNELKLREKISIIFLLCKDPKNGLQIMESILQEPDFNIQNNLFYKWMREQSIFLHKDWCDKLAEVLTIIQNYRLGKVLGFLKTDLKEKFMPKNNLKSISISNLRKVLYNLCEELTSVTFRKLISLIESGHEYSNKKIPNTFIQYLEIRLLLWSEEGIINLREEKGINLDVLIASLKSLGLNNFLHDIEVVVEKTNCHLVRNKSFPKEETFDYYEITDTDNIGLCVIINEKYFVNSLFPKRWGSEKDVERLNEVFTAFGFHIRLHFDLTYEQFIKILQYYAKTIDKNYSFFVLIILSHGSENVIYTSDTVPVDMNTIEMMFQAEVCPSLIGKPKIFIVQSCQGEKWQKVLTENESSEIFADNLAHSVPKQVVKIGPQKGDSMIAWSTVQGFASFRDKYNGSWYIQELCNELWKYGDALDLVEIFTRVNNNLRRKVYSGQFMVPSLLLSLRAKIKFPHLKNNFIKGRQLMLNRLIFDRYFREFLTTNTESEFASFIKC